MTKIVLPTVEEYLADRGNPRRAIIACVMAYHVRDYMEKAGACTKQDVDRAIKGLYPLSWEVVEGVCNGSKHVRNTQRGNFKFTIGDQRRIPAFTAGVSFWGHARLGVPGLVVGHQGRSHYIDNCLCAVLGAFGRAFPELSGIDLEGYGQKVPGWPSAP